MKKQKKPMTAGKQKAIFFAGVFLVTIAVFMSSFVFSIQMILSPVNDKSSTEKNLAEENQKLKQDLNLLQDQYDILEAKQGKKSTSSKTSSKSTEKKSISQEYDEDDEEN